MINLLPNKGRRAVRADYFGRLATTAIVLVALALLLSNILLALLAWRLQVEADGLANLRTAEEGKTDRATLVAAKKLLAQARSRLNVLNNLETPGKSPADLFEKITVNKTTGIKITSLSYSTSTSQAGMVVLAGLSDTRGNLLKWVEVLKAEESFSMVESPIGNIIKERGGAFNITLTIK